MAAKELAPPTGRMWTDGVFIKLKCRKQIMFPLRLSGVQCRSSVSHISLKKTRDLSTRCVCVFRLHGFVCAFPTLFWRVFPRVGVCGERPGGVCVRRWRGAGVISRGLHWQINERAAFSCRLVSLLDLLSSSNSLALVLV